MVPAAAQTVFGFDSSQEFTQYFTEAGLSPGEQFLYSTNPGVGGVPGRVDKGFDFSESLNFREPFGFGVRPTLSFATVFFYNQESYSPGRENLPIIQLGVVNGLTNGLSRSFPDTAYVLVSMAVGTDGVDRKLEAGTKTVGNTVQASTYSTNFSIGTGFYEIRGDWMLAGGGQFDFVASLFSRGADGTGSPLLVSTLAGTLVNNDIAADDSVFAAVSGAYFSLAYIDNFTIIPEPTTPGIFLGGLAVFALRWRRVHRRS